MTNASVSRCLLITPRFPGYDIGQLLDSMRSWFRVFAPRVTDQWHEINKVIKSPFRNGSVGQLDFRERRASVNRFINDAGACLRRTARRSCRSARTGARYVARWIYMVHRGSRDNVVARTAVPAPAVFTGTTDTRSSIKRAATSSASPWNDFPSVITSS